MADTKKRLTLALPKGRLEKQIQKFLEEKGFSFSFENRKLVAVDKTGSFEVFLVKNSDLPTYIKHGIAGIGVCGDDVLYEAGSDLFKLREFDYGGTRMCLAGMKGTKKPGPKDIIKVATKFVNFTRDHYNQKGQAVEIVKLNGSVELAPVLGLTPYIVDLVETGSTLKANNLEVLEDLKTIKVYMVANPAYYKIYYKEIQDFLKAIE